MPLGNSSIPSGKIPIQARAVKLYIKRMKTFEIIWRGLILLGLAFLAWINFNTGGIMAGSLLLLCVPVWLYVGLYSLEYI
jgi:membrane protein CcdC involved in cytochrome C biogenesis